MVPRKALSPALIVAVLACGLTSNCNTPVIYIRFENAGPERHPVLLFTGWRRGACRRNEVYALREAGVVRLGRVNPAHRGCQAEITAFAESLGAVAGRWPAGPSQDLRLEGNELRVRFPDMRTLPVKVWVLTPAGAEVSPDVAKQLDTANAIFWRFRVGAQLGAKVQLVTQTDDLTEMFEGECYHTSDLRDASLFREDSVNVYVYLHYGLDDVLVDPMGRNCGHVGARSDVVFLYRATYPATLAHELGHAMGLLEPNWGDVDDQPGFVWEPPYGSAACRGPSCESNLMISEVNPVEDVTLGQIYRMNLDVDSWWNRFGSVRPFSDMSRQCHPPDSRRQCPPLDLREEGNP